MSAADLTLEFLEGGGSANNGGDRSACPYYATSNAAEAWHAGFAWHSLGYSCIAIDRVTNGRGNGVNLIAPRYGRRCAAIVDWDAGEIPVVSFPALATDASLAELRRLGAPQPAVDRCDCEECAKLDRLRLQGIPGTYQIRLLEECRVGRHEAPLAPPPARIAASVDSLPLFIGSLEPTLF